jgi:hypothetical protein
MQDCSAQLATPQPSNLNGDSVQYLEGDSSHLQDSSSHNMQDCSAQLATPQPSNLKRDSVQYLEGDSSHLQDSSSHNMKHQHGFTADSTPTRQT